MPKYGTERSFVVFELVHSGYAHDREPVDSLLYIKAFEKHSDAESWILDEGYRHRNYVIIEQFRNK